MDKSIKTNLCKGLRACGIPKVQTHQILNIVEKWYHESGPEWTNSRIKDLRQWYETTLAGEPVPPEWFRHTKDGYPTGIWNWVFKLPPAKALGILSLNTVFYESRVSETQKEKFLKGLAGNGASSRILYTDEEAPVRPVKLPKRRPMPRICFPTVFDMNGSIPIHDGHHSVQPNNSLGAALEALRLSWESVPQVTFDFLIRENLIGYMPKDVVGNDYVLELERPHDRCVGRVSVIQQPQLKARWIGNPNRILQVTLEPLKQIYMDRLRKLPTDVTHDQASGVRWAQDMLRQGVKLAGSDLTSASDLLDLDSCLCLVDHTFGFSEVWEGYKEYTDYFYEVCRCPWYCPELHCEVKWEQGDVLGTGPSFGLLSLTNNAAAMQAYGLCIQEGTIDESISWKDSFRVVGDDILMRAEMQPHYARIICDLGGEINHTKTLESNCVAEFAGRVITADSSYLKAIKFSEPSDNSFMDYVAQLGDQAKYLLRPRQRKVYDRLAEVPGVAVPGPWVQDSYGVPLDLRYQWYLEEVQPALSRVEPDLKLTDYSLVLLKAQLSLNEDNESISNREAAGLSVPSFDEPLIDDGYLPSQVTPSFKVGGDPRLVNGQDLLTLLESKLEAWDLMPFKEWCEVNQTRLGLSRPDESLPPHEDTSEIGEGLTPQPKRRTFDDWVR